MKMRVLNSKEVKKVVQSIESQYSINNLRLGFAFIEGVDDRLFVIDKKLAEIDMGMLRINSLGMYFGTHESDKVRLSIEGSQVIGPMAKKNVVDLSKNQVDDWIRGSDVEVGCEGNDIVLVKHNNDFFGSGKLSRGRILNFIPKSRRIKALNQA
jgi:NOL1/NOP2/fmu family ribosome biogenesis protein